jgi:hypothetical protein
MTEEINVTGIEAFSYLRKQLDIGISLSNCINSLSIEDGEVYSFVPAGTSREKIYNFNLGGIYPFQKEELSSSQLNPIRNDSRQIAICKIRKHIEADDKNCCIFENPNASPYFPWVKTLGIEYVHLRNEEMFFFFDKNNDVIEHVENAFIISEAYIFLCALSSLNENDHSNLAAFKEITVDILELFVKNLSSFFVKAYDGEGYLMWVKR